MSEIVGDFNNGTGIPTTIGPYIPEDEKNAYLACLVGVALMSALASVFFNIRYLFCKKARHHLTEIIQFRCLFDTLYSIFIVILAWSRPEQSTPACNYLSLVIQIFGSASEIYAFILSVDVILAIMDPFTNFNKRRWIYFFSTVVLATGCGILVWQEAFYSQIGSSVSPVVGCFNQTDLNYGNAAYWVEANLPAITLYLVSFCNLVASLCWLSRGVRLSDALAARRNAIKTGIRYLLGYFFYWLLIRVVFIQIKVAGTDTADWEKFLHVILISARGIVTLVLWLFGTRPVRSCCGLRKIQITEASDDIHTILRQELLFYTKLGITVSVNHARKQRRRQRMNGPFFWGA